jgi:hypothetical protein
VAFLDRDVDVVVLDRSGIAPGESHLQLMAEAVDRHRERFESLGRFPITRDGQVFAGAIEVWRVRRGLGSRDPS